MARTGIERGITNKGQVLVRQTLLTWKHAQPDRLHFVSTESMTCVLF